jgi:predicted transcriptional regulator
LPGPVRDPRAGALLRRYHERFGGSLRPPVPVEAIARDLLGLNVSEADTLAVSGMLLPAEREVWLNAAEPAPRRRFTLAHELGHWVCQVQEGRTAPLYCRAADVTPEPAAKALEREANVFAAELLMPEELVREAWEGDVEAAAERFGVSGEAMGWRAYNLAVLTTKPV